MDAPRGADSDATSGPAWWSREAAVLLLAVVVVLAAVGAGAYYAAPDAGGSSAGDSKLQFLDVTRCTGFDYAATKTGAGNGNSGVYVADVDDDGWSDVLALGGPRPVLFENDGGNFTRSGALPAVDGTVQGALFFDYDDDGWEDLLLLRRHGTALFFENVRGTFEPRSVGLEVDLEVPVTASAADYDGDGDLDVFVAQYGDWEDRTPKGYARSLPVERDNGNPNYLFRNDDGSFEQVTGAGIEGSRWSLATSFVDLTGDGRPDIHVANDYNRDVVYVNRGDGRFDRRPLGEATDRNGMSSEVADVNGDERPDILVTNIYLPVSKENVSAEKYDLIENYQRFVLGKRTKGNTLLVNRGNGRFVDRAAEYGVRAGGWGWAAALSDFDNDGRPDLFTTTQYVVRIDESDPVYTYPMLWRRSDETFVRADASAVGFAEADGRGAAELDYDRDGAMDLLVAVADGEYTLYENQVTGHSVTLSVRSDRGSAALGASVSVTADGRRQTRILNAKADYQSQDTRTLHFGLGDAPRVDVRVEWADGTVRRFEDVEANRHLVVTPDGIERQRPHRPESATTDC